MRPMAWPSQTHDSLAPTPIIRLQLRVGGTPRGLWLKLEGYNPYGSIKVDGAFMLRWPHALFLQDLPAHRGDEVAGEALDGPRSLAWTQATMKLPSAMAVLEHTVGLLPG